MRNHVLTALLVVGAALAATNVGATSVATKVAPTVKLPNIILIVSDDQGYADVGYHGSTEIPTPGIDRIAHEGTYFTQGYVSYPVCGPSRAGFLTGRYQGRFGFSRNPTMNPDEPTSGLAVEEDMISEVLKTVGYTNMAIGKWHMGIQDQYHPLNQGFDSFFGFLSGGHRYFPELLTLNSFDEVTNQFGWYRMKLLDDWQRVDIDQYLTDELSDRAVDFIEQEQSGPFFLYLAYNAPHSPMEATQEYLDRFAHIRNKKRRTYAAMVSAMDDGIGSVLDKLDELEIADNTLVFFFSDNGGPEKKNASDNGPLRDGKGSLFEGGVRVPFAMRWPEKLQGGQVYDEPISSLDVLGTVVAATGASINPERPLDGVDLLPYLLGEAQGRPHDVLFWRQYDKGSYAVNGSNVKLVANERDARLALFDLDEDIGEANDVKESRPDETDSLQQQYEDWNNEMIEPAFPALRSWNPKGRK